MAKTDLDIELLRRALSGGLVGSRLIYYDSLTSTMDEARRLAERGEPEGTVVIAEEQTAGWGRFSRLWVSPRGENLSFSVLLRPTPAQLPFMNMAATLAISDGITEATGLTSRIKWPNDVRIGGLKVSGILIETVLEAGKVDHAVVGIGVNVNFDPAKYPETASTATSVYRETCTKTDRGALLQVVLRRFGQHYDRVKAGHSLTGEWARQMETLGRRVRIVWRDQMVEGTAESVDEQGNLIVKRMDGSIFTAVAGEVALQV